MSSETIKRALTNQRIHIIGIAGTLMGAFAVLLKRSGVSVTGSDQNIYPPMSDVLAKADIKVFTPFHPDNIAQAQPDLVIVGNVVRKTNPEMQAVLDQKLEYASLPSFLETKILPHKHSIVVAGTHGKTTTTSMMAWILESLNEQPSFFIGGVVKNFTESFRINDSRFMVLEGDEYDTAFFDKVAKFTHYLPKDVILTSVEYDHADIYPDMNAVIQAFNRLAEITDQQGYFVVCAENEVPLRIAQQTSAQVLTYGFSDQANSYAKQIVLNEKGAQFKWFFRGEERMVHLAANGKHNVLNALACLTLIAARNLDVDKAVAALKTYQGVKRRQEIYGVASNITLIDDFAHHPTAVRETLAAIRSKFPSARIVACFEPRSATSRKKVFQQAYTESFDLADRILIAKPYSAPPASSGPASVSTSKSTTVQSSEPNDVFSSDQLVDALKKRNKKASLLATTDLAIKELTKELRSGDVVLVMSNGGFDNLLPRLLKALQ